MRTLPIPTGQHEGAPLATEALAAAGTSLLPFQATEVDRSMAAYDLAACIRSVAPMLTVAERAAFARALYPERQQ